MMRRLMLGLDLPNIGKLWPETSGWELRPDSFLIGAAGRPAIHRRTTERAMVTIGDTRSFDLQFGQAMSSAE